MPDDKVYPWFHGARSWEEDAEQENGNYQGFCSTCKNSFTGNKHRTECKTCAHRRRGAERDALEAENRAIYDMINQLSDDFVKLTTKLSEHPDEYNGPCFCMTCQSYGDG